MKKWIQRYWWLAIPILPFLIMFLLHISIALGDYFNININIPNIYANDWFMFFSSYLGGSVALIGVILTIRHSMNTHNHQIAMEKMEKERDVIVQALSKLDVQEPISILKLFMSMNENANITTSELAIINDRIYNMQHLISQARLSVFISSGATIINPNCSVCRTPCTLKEVIPEFSKEFESLTGTLHQTLNKLDVFIRNRIRNDKLIKEVIICENANIVAPLTHSIDKIDSLKKQIISLDKDIDELLELSEKCASMSQKELTNLIALSRSYFIQRQENARKACFEDWKGGQ